MKVVGKDAVEADVRVDDEGECQRAVQEGGRAVLDHSNGDQRHKRGREGALECPVVGAMSRVGLGEGCGVVDCALDICCWYAKQVSLTAIVEAIADTYVLGKRQRQRPPCRCVQPGMLWIRRR